MSSNTHPTIDAPFGAWVLDSYISQLKPSRFIHNIGHAYVFVHEERYAGKVLNRGDVMKEIQMMLLAGPDCSIQPLGRIFRGDNIVGFMMPYEKGLAPGEIMGGDAGPRPTLSKDEKRSIIDKICRLVERVHEKGLVHGDVKPSNFLLCADGEVRLCDWAVASSAERKDVPWAISVQYASPQRCRAPLELLTPAADLYAVGISIWEIWVEKVPFANFAEGDVDFPVEDLIMAGVRPDLHEVDDPNISALITTYLDMGDPSPDPIGQASTLCIRTDFVFTHCRATPSHTYGRVIKCMNCVEPHENWTPCQVPFLIPTPVISSTNLLCTRCNPIKYLGLTSS